MTHLLNECQADFALKLFHQIQSKDFKTLVISPIAISLSLSIIYNGASGETSKQILALLCGDNVEENLNEYFGKVYQQLKSMKSSNFDLHNVIRSFVKCDFQPNTNIINAIKNRFDENVIPKMNKEGGDLNDLIKMEIPKYSGFFDPVNYELSDYGMLLINIMYFNGEWKNQFDAQGVLSVKETFYVNKEVTRDVYYMEMGGNVYVESETYYDVLGLEYIDNCTMIIILPKEKFGLRSVLNRLDGKTLIKHAKNRKEQYVNINLPRFCCKTQIDVVEILKAFGCIDVFNQENAELFSNSNPNSRIFVEHMLHNFEIKALEKGTENETCFCDYSYQGPGYFPIPYENEYSADHPFCFYISDKHCNILFFGVVEDNFQPESTPNLQEEFRNTFCSLYALPFTKKFREMEKQLPNKHVFDLEVKNESYFENPFLQKTYNFEQKVNEEWLLMQIGTTIYKICNRKITHIEVSKNEIFSGIGGIVYALLRAAKYVEPMISSSYFHVCEQYMNSQKFVSKENLSYPKFLKGSLGLHVVKALLCAVTSHSYEIDKIFADIDLEKNNICERDYDILAAILCLRTEIKKDVFCNRKINGIVSSLLANIQLKYVQQNFAVEDCPELLGMLQILLNFWEYLNESEKKSIQEFLNLILKNQRPDGSFSSRNNESNLGCQICDAACRLFIVAYISLDDKKYLDAAKKCCDLIWKQGLSFVRHGLSGGIPGNGYSLLLMYRLTKDENYLKKAKLFALLMIQTQNCFRENAYSLFEGWAGSLCFLVDILQPNNAQFPLFSIPF